METNNPRQDSHFASQSSEQNIYEELKGYFPEQYDLTPQELEDAIRQRQNSFKAKRIKRSLPEQQSIIQSPPSTQPIEEDLTQYAPPMPDTNPWANSISAEEEKEKPSIIRFFSDAFDILEVFVLCTVCILLVFAFIARLTRVDGYSMNDTLQNGEFLIVSDLFYTPKQGDIVVLHNTALEVDKLREPLVKRIIAVGGQTVNIAADGTVTVTNADGTSEILEQEYIKQEPYNKNALECYVPEGYVFVMGDNRNNSTDSRDVRVGLIDERCVCGRAVLRIFPFNAFAVFKNPMVE